MNALLLFSVRVSLAALGVAAILRAARVRTDAVRHAAWLAVLGAMLLMPVLPYIVPAVEVPVGIPAHEATAETLPAVEDSAPVAGADRAGARTGAAAEPRREIDWRLLAWCVYGLGVGLLGARFVAGWRAAIGIASRAEAIPGLAVFESAGVSAPVTIGRRVILPSGWREWPVEKLRAVLAHEEAHVRRRDAWTAAVAQANRCVFWFHPLAWWLVRELAMTAEHACDDAAVRAVGESRRYAEILLEIADAVRRSGGRRMWQAVGIDGTGLLGERIDRILRRDSWRRISRIRMAMVGVACAAAIFLAAACRQKMAAGPLVDDPKMMSRAQSKANWEQWDAAKAMQPEQVAQMEAALQANPEDTESRRKLLYFYFWSGEKVLGEAKAIEARRAHILWTIEHHPAEPLGAWAAQISPVEGDRLRDSVGYEAGRKLWLAAAEKSGANARTLENAAMFLRVADKPLAEKMILRAKALDPKGSWAGQLGQLYYEVLTGSAGASWYGVVRPVSMAAAHSPYAGEIRKRLAESDDVKVLGMASFMLIQSGSILNQDHRLDFDPVALGREIAERVLKLDPENVRAHMSLLAARQLAAGTPRLLAQTLDGRHPGGGPLEAQYAEALQAPENERFKKLVRLAQTAYVLGDGAGWESAGKYADEALATAQKFRGDPEYGAAVFNANLTLGLVSMSKGDKAGAVRHMLQASRAPASEAIVYGHEYFAQKLAGDLLKSGERDSVVEFLERYAKTNLAERDSLLQAAAQIRAGQKPIWYPN